MKSVIPSESPLKNRWSSISIAKNVKTHIKADFYFYFYYFYLSNLNLVETSYEIHFYGMHRRVLIIRQVLGFNTAGVGFNPTPANTCKVNIYLPL